MSHYVNYFRSFACLYYTNLQYNTLYCMSSAHYEWFNCTECVSSFLTYFVEVSEKLIRFIFPCSPPKTALVALYCSYVHFGPRHLTSAWRIYFETGSAFALRSLFTWPGYWLLPEGHYWEVEEKVLTSVLVVIYPIGNIFSLEIAEIFMLKKKENFKIYLPGCPCCSENVARKNSKKWVT